MALTIGSDEKTGSAVLLDEAHRESGMYIIGKPQMGKTSLLADIIAQDMRAGSGICVLDPSGDLVSRVLQDVPASREHQVVLLDARDYEFPFALNPFDSKGRNDPLTVNRIQGQFVDIFRKLWGQEGSLGSSWGPRLEDLLRSIALTFIDNPPYTMAEISLLLSNQSFRDSLVANVRNDEVKQFWAEFNGLRGQALTQEISSTMNKVRAFLTQPIVKNIIGQSHSSVDFGKFMQDSNIVLIPLSKGQLGPDTTQLLGSLFVLEVLNAALQREELRGTGKLMPRFSLFADEYQNFVSLSFATLLEEARKYNVDVTFAHQNRSQLDERNLAASLMASAIIAFGVDGEDASQLARQFDRTPPATTRQVPVRNICQTPVEYLVHHPHKGSNVNYISREWLTPFVESTQWQAPTRIHRLEKSYLERFEARRDYRKNILPKLDRYLVSMMSGAIEPFSNEHADTTVELVWALQNTADQAIFELFDPPKQLTRKVRGALLDLFFVMEADPFKKDREAYEQAERALDAVLHAEQIPTPPMKDFTTLTIIYGLLGVMLAHDPIYLETGQWEAVADNRPFEDVKAERENELVNLGQFVAHCKVLQGRNQLSFTEFTISTPRPVSRTENSDLTDRVREMSRALCTPRAAVEDQIRQRQLLAVSGSGPYDPRTRMVVLDESHGSSFLESTSPGNALPQPAEEPRRAISQSIRIVPIAGPAGGISPIDFNPALPQSAAMLAAGGQPPHAQNAVEDAAPQELPQGKRTTRLVPIDIELPTAPDETPLENRSTSQATESQPKPMEHPRAGGIQPIPGPGKWFDSSRAKPNGA